MENTAETLALADATSPSRITDYFNTRKTSGKRGRGRKAKNKEKLPAKAPSVYLTPESSPPNTVDSSEVKFTENTTVTDSSESHSVTKSMETETGAEVSQEPRDSETGESGETTILYECELSMPSLSPEISELHDDVPHKPYHATDVPQTEPESAKKTDSPSISEDIVSAVVKDSKTTEVACSSASQTISAQNSAADSPSLPRPKLRKGSKAKSQSTALLTDNSAPVKPKPGRRKKKEPEPVQKSTITDFFPVRRSSRQTKSEIEKEKQHQLEEQIKSKCEDGLEIKEFENKGRGIVATKAFSKGDFVVEYAGDLLDVTTARKVEAEYAKDLEIGCYMYFFMCGDKQYCVDATKESSRLGRLINHSRDGNCCTKSVVIDDVPRLFLVAKQDIKIGEELNYDYGDRSKDAIEAHPWLKL